MENVSPACLDTLFKLKNTPYDMRNSKILDQPSRNTVTYGIQSISYLGPKIWNLLPPDIRNIETLGEFKLQIRNIELREIDASYNYFV